MKKILVSILALLYLASSVGTTVHLHYCMDQLINWSLSNKEGDECGKCGMDKDGGCCKDENKFVKNNVDQKVTEPAAQFMRIAAVATPVGLIYPSEHYFSALIKEYPISHAPPRDNSVGIYLLNRVFRI